MLLTVGAVTIAHARPCSDVRAVTGKLPQAQKEQMGPVGELGSQGAEGSRGSLPPGRVQVWGNHGPGVRTWAEQQQRQDDLGWSAGPGPHPLLGGCLVRPGAVPGRPPQPVGLLTRMPPMCLLSMVSLPFYYKRNVFLLGT